MESIKIYILLFLLTTLGLTFTKCKISGRQDGIHKIIVDFSRAADLFLTDLYQDIRYIPLKMHGDVLPSANCVLKFSDEHIGIFDASENKKFFLFQRDGTYLFSIDGGDRGPDGFISANDFIFEADDSSIIVPDVMTRTIKYYSMEGRMKRSRKVPFNVNEITQLENGDLLLSTKNLPDSEFGIIQMDSTFKEVAAWCPLQDWQKDITPVARQLIGNGDMVFYYCWFDSYIYQIKSDGCSILLKLDFKQGHLSEEDKDILSDNKSHYPQSILNNPVYYSTGSFLYSDSLLLISYYFDKSTFLLIIDVREKKSKLFKLSRDKQNYLLYPRLTGSDGKNCYYLLEANQLTDHVLPIKDTWPQVDFSSLQGLKPEDNPVLVEAEFNHSFIESVLE